MKNIKERISYIQDDYNVDILELEKSYSVEIKNSLNFIIGNFKNDDIDTIKEYIQDCINFDLHLEIILKENFI
jgi:hypothetical protein